MIYIDTNEEAHSRFVVEAYFPGGFVYFVIVPFLHRDRRHFRWERHYFDNPS